jgi:hypothetical protein
MKYVGARRSVNLCALQPPKHGLDLAGNRGLDALFRVSKGALLDAAAHISAAAVVGVVTGFHVAHNGGMSGAPGWVYPCVHLAVSIVHCRCP